jgi:diguanylate cyclase (GGDEF)-like protein
MLAQRANAEAAMARDDQAEMPDAQAILEAIGGVTYEWDLRLDCLSYGSNANQILGFADIDQISTGRAFAQHMSPQSASTRYHAVIESPQQDVGAGVAYHVVYGLTSARNCARSEQPIKWIEDQGRWFAGPDGRPLRARGVMRAITDREEAERKRIDSQFDVLTGALHRARFIGHTAKRLAECIRKGGTFAILLTSLENLYAFNRTYGYDVGDELLAAVAARMRGQMRSTDLLSRYAGNKFALFLEGCDTEQMEGAARRILAAVEDAAFLTTAGQIAANLHVGGVIAPEHGRTIQAVLRHVEDALDAARQSAGDRFAPYVPSLAREDARIRYLQISDEIVAALNQGRVVLALQPVVVAKTHELAFYEALLRLDGEEGQLITPSTILPVAEKTGLIQLIDQRMLELAAAQLAHDAALRLSLNVSGMSLLDQQWLERLRAACKRHSGIADRLIIEITETSAISDIDATRRAIEGVKACGAKIAMDDFGAGHTSFRNLRSLHVDLLKIDGAFVQNLSVSEDDRVFVRTLVELANHLGIPTVAEWVEDEESATILAGWGVDYLQGHYFGAAQALGFESADRETA